MNRRVVALMVSMGLCACDAPVVPEAGMPLQQTVPPLDTWGQYMLGRPVGEDPPIQDVPYLAFVPGDELHPPTLLGAYGSVERQDGRALAPSGDPSISYIVGWTTQAPEAVSRATVLRAWRFPGGRVRIDVQEHQLTNPLDMTSVHAGMDASGHLFGPAAEGISSRLPRSTEALADVRLSVLRPHEWRVPEGIRYVRHPHDPMWLAGMDLEPGNIEWYFQHATAARWEAQNLYPAFDERGRRVSLTFTGRQQQQNLPLPNTPQEMLAGALPLLDDELIQWYVDGACTYYRPQQRAYCRRTIVTTMGRVLTGEQIAWQDDADAQADGRQVGDVWWWSERVGQDALPGDLNVPRLHRLHYLHGVDEPHRQTMLVATMLYNDRVEIWPLSAAPSGLGLPRPPLPDMESRYSLRQVAPELTLYQDAIEDVFLGSPHAGAIVLRGGDGWYIYLIGYSHADYGLVVIDPHPNRHPAVLH